MSVLIKGGRIVTAVDDYVADVLIEGETIAAVGTSLNGSADRVIDAAGKYVIPGAIDPHTHMEMPFGGTVSCDDFTSGTVSAAFGGTTSLIDFCLQAPGQSIPDALATWHEKIERCPPVIDVGFHMAITDLHDGGRLEDVARVPDEGVTSYKLFMAYKGAIMVDDETLFRTMQVAARTGRARHGPRRERRRDRRARQAGAGRGQDRAALACRHPPARDRGRGDQPRDQAGPHRRLPAVRRPRLLPGVGRADRDRAVARLADVGRDLHPVPVHRRDPAGGARLRRGQVRVHAAAAARRPTTSTCGRRCKPASCRSSPPTTARSAGATRRRSVATTSPRSPTAARGWRTACTCCTTSACARAG